MLSEQMETPIASDPNVLESIYRHFTYLRDHSLKLNASFIEEGVCLGELQTEEFLGFLMAYGVEHEHPIRDHFPFLSPEENLSLTHYRHPTGIPFGHIRPVQPWPQPVIGILWNSQQSQGIVTGTHRVDDRRKSPWDVPLKNIGNAQLWWGNEVAILWEAFFDMPIRERHDHEHLMHQLWETLERYLATQGVKRVLTYDRRESPWDGRDPAFENEWYRTFLKARDYRVHAGDLAMLKALE